MAVIREDKHGLYVKVGGYVFRPIFPASYSHRYTDGSKYTVGEKVYGRHRSQSSLATVGDETWFAHGCYGGHDCDNRSEAHYKPSYEKWPETGESNG